jgi:hypothetical protein
VSVLEEAAASLREGKDGAITADRAGLDALASALAAYFDSDELVEVVEELCQFAMWVKHDKEAPAAGDAVLRVAETAIPALKALARGGTDRAESLATTLSARDFSRFSPERQSAKPELAPPKSKKKR